MNIVSNSYTRRKLLTILLLITFCFIALFGRLIYLQVISADGITVRGVSQWTRDLPMMAERGDIVDRNGVVLADSSTVYSMYVRPNALKEHEKVAKTVAETLNKDYKAVYEKVTRKGVSEVTVAKGVSKGDMLKISAYDYDGVYFTEESKRYFPYGNFLSQVLGFTNADGAGQAGVEQYYDKYLKGANGKAMTETDLVGKELEGNITKYLPAIDGMTARLTIDYYIQSFAERAVADAMATYQAKSAYCLVMNPNTGEIYAMAQAPSFDLNNIPRDDVNALFDMSKNKMISSVYEPGSTFKILTSAIGLEEKAFPAGHRFYCNGARIVDGQRIKCWQSRGHGSQSFADGVRNSCNCVFMDIATTVGTAKMYDYLRKFGVNVKTGVDMLGEASGLMLKEEIVKNVDLARVGFGQAIAVTPIALASAVSACINGGRSVTPYVLGSMTDRYFGKVIDNKGVQGERIISSETSDYLKECLYSVVEQGSGKKAYVPGYRIGGKTGTAQKYANGGIAAGKYVSSFIGFTRAGDEDYVCLMVVDEPQGYVYYGSIVAAPYVGDIFANIFAYKNIPPNYTAKEKEELGKTFIMPNLMDMSIEEALRTMRKLGVPFEYTGSSGTVNYQLPAPGAECNYNTVSFFNAG